jgi:hypothetical protein
MNLLVLISGTGIDQVMRRERAATMNQTHIRGLVTSIPSIRRGPASL